MRREAGTGAGLRPGTRPRTGGGTATAGRRQIACQWPGLDGTGRVGRRSRPSVSHPLPPRTPERSGPQWAVAGGGSARRLRRRLGRPPVGYAGPWPTRSQPPRPGRRWPGDRGGAVGLSGPSCEPAVLVPVGRFLATGCVTGRKPPSGRCRQPPGPSCPTSKAADAFRPPLFG